MEIEALMPQVLAYLERWVGINSFSLSPNGVNETGRAVNEAFAPLGFEASATPAENKDFGSHLFLKKIGKSDKSIAFVAHLDTVYTGEEEQENHFRWQPEGDRIYGPGVCDDKGGIAMIWLILAALKDHPLFDEVTWIVALNAAEEHLAADFPDRCREQFPADTRACLVFEGCGWDADKFLMVTSRKGSANFRVTVEGRAAHAGNSHDQGANAIHELALLIPRIEALTNYASGLTVNVGIIHGGVADNRVPHFAEAIVNMRAFDENVLAQGIAAMQQLAEESPKVFAASDGFPCKVSIEVTHQNSSWPSNPPTEELFSIWKDTATQLGITLESEQRGGLSDANRLWKIAPTLDGLGPAGDNDHCSVRSADGSRLPEFVLPGSFLPMAKVNIAAIVQLLA